MLDHITYTEMVGYFGKEPATDLLKCVERLAEIENEIIQFDKNARWETALRTLNEIN
jgi:hypothetical protein